MTARLRKQFPTAKASEVYLKEKLKAVESALASQRESISGGSSSNWSMHLQEMARTPHLMLLDGASKASSFQTQPNTSPADDFGSHTPPNPLLSNEKLFSPLPVVQRSILVLLMKSLVKLQRV